MKRILSVMLIAIVIVVLAACGNNNGNKDGNGETNSSDSSRDSLVFSTQGLGTSFNTMTNAFSQVVKSELPDGMHIDIQTTSPGGIAAAYIIAEGKADLTIGNTAPANWATSEGIDGKEVAEGVQSLGGGFDAPIALAVFTDKFIEKTGYTSIEEIVENEYPVRIATKDSGSFGEMTARKVLETLGVTFEDIESWGGSVTLTASSNVIDLLRDDRADITIDHTNLDQPNYVELAMTTKIHVVGLQDKTIQALLDSGYAKQLIPKGSFEGAAATDIETVGSPTALLVGENVSEDVAYAMTKAIAENKEDLVNGFASFEVFDPLTACEQGNAGAPLHPGAEKYYKENGCLD